MVTKLDTAPARGRGSMCLSRALTLVWYTLIPGRRPFACGIAVAKSCHDALDSNVGRRDGRSQPLIFVKQLHVRCQNSSTLCVAQGRRGRQHLCGVFQGRPRSGSGKRRRQCSHICAQPGARVACQKRHLRMVFFFTTSFIYFFPFWYPRSTTTHKHFTDQEQCSTRWTSGWSAPSPESRNRVRLRECL